MDLTCSAILFDLDGVLIDSLAVVRRHWKKWARQHQVPMDRLMEIAHGRTSAEIIRVVAPQLDADAEGRRREEEEGLDTRGLRVYPSARKLLLSIPEGRWGVVTSGRPQTALTRLQFGRLPVPPVLVTADDVQHGKPSPEPYLYGAQRLEVSPSHCIAVEDSPAGIQSGQAAGMKVIAVATTHGPHELGQADYLLRGISAISIHDAGDHLRVVMIPINELPDRMHRPRNRLYHSGK